MDGCVSIEQPSGSLRAHMGKRVCRDAAEVGGSHRLGFETGGGDDWGSGGLGFVGMYSNETRRRLMPARAIITLVA